MEGLLLFDDKVQRGPDLQFEQTRRCHVPCNPRQNLIEGIPECGCIEANS